MSEPLARLVEVLRGHYGREQAAHPGERTVYDALLGALARPSTQRPARLEKPAVALLPAALAAARQSPLAELAAAFGALEPSLAWTQNPNYSDAKLGAGYMAGYAYADVVGPRGLIASDTVAMGALLLGPGRLYPDHTHPATELYHVLSGTADWSRDGGDFAAQPPGRRIFHPPWMRHAMRVGEETLFAWYGWVGDVRVAADLVKS
jgi:hypothetical protein